jgi:hypothetical protein
VQPGNREVHDVVASIASVKGSVLPGQSISMQFKPRSFDAGRGVLALE